MTDEQKAIMLPLARKRVPELLKELETLTTILIGASKQPEPEVRRQGKIR
jgi:hypothetical protein